LFGFPLTVGVILTGIDSAVILGLKGRGLPSISAIVIALVATVTISFVIELAVVRPSPSAVAAGLLPSAAVLSDPVAIYLAVGILGATVMPHNLYLHSALTRGPSASKGERIRLGTYDTVLSLGLATFVNAAILAVAASVFNGTGDVNAGIDDAHRLLAPLGGTGIAGTLFAVALLAAGHSSTFTGSMAGQAIVDGFFGQSLPAWKQQLLTRTLAVLLALGGVVLLGDGSAGTLLVLSQVILSLQLPFAIFPLIRFAASRRYMGDHVIARPSRYAAWVVFAVICFANLYLLASVLTGAANAH
jgi:manganese transport protein